MKKPFYLAVLFFLLAIPIQAQENEIKHENGFGFKAGINYTNYTLGKDFPEGFPAKFHGDIGFHVGLIYTFHLSNSFYFQPELLFSTLHSEYKFDYSLLDLQEPGGSDRYNINYNENIILIPLLVHYNISPLLDVELGPQLGYSLNETFRSNSVFYDYSSTDYDRFELAINAGFGFNFLNHYRIGLRYGYAITERNNTKNFALQFGLQYKLR